MAEQCHGEDSGESRPAQHHRCAPCSAAARSTGQHYRTDREAFRDLMQKNRDEDDPAQRVRNQEPRSNGDSIEEGVNDQSEQDRVAAVAVNKLIVMRFFTKVEM